MTILEKIIAHKKKEVSWRKSSFPLPFLEKTPLFESSTISLSEQIINNSSGIIAEHKRRSPSKPKINNKISLDDVVKGYEQAGVCGMSILTDTQFFGGSLEDLVTARKLCNKPLLRKDFIIDEYQLIESKAHGADVILLIAASLPRKDILRLSTSAKNLGLEVLLEVHNEEELERGLMPTIDLLGVNNRNLKTFEVSIQISLELAAKIPDDFVKVSESGISSVAAIQELKKVGYSGFLIGEKFMKTTNPGQAATEFINIIEG
tara:strand:+ start:2128 stop:2913 length:786 start_codon:yes stop_codon:yes gene_type:complete